jgi:hypothetical protein
MAIRSVMATGEEVALKKKKSNKYDERVGIPVGSSAPNLAKYVFGTHSP